MLFLAVVGGWLYWQDRQRAAAAKDSEKLQEIFADIASNKMTTVPSRLDTLATDGGDGPTDAAGAVVTGETLARARALGYDAGDFLQRHDAYNFFAPLDALLRPGPTLTNVNDLLFIVATTPAS